SPGTFSALGLLATNLSHEYATTMLARVDRVDVAAIERAFQGLEAQGRAALARDGVADEAGEIQRIAELRYVGQSYELPIPLRGDLDQAAISGALEQFH